MISAMTSRLPLIGLIAVAGLFAAPAVQASSINDDIRSCQTALEEQTPDKFENAEYDFKSVRGSGLKKLKFRIEVNNQRSGIVTCKVRRGDVVAIEWPQEKA